MLTIRRKQRRIGRNEICPCGKSGKKFKYCCLPKFEAKERSRLAFINVMAQRLFDKLKGKDNG